LIPYPSIQQTQNLGWHTVFLVWLGLIIIQVIIFLFKSFYSRTVKQDGEEPVSQKVTKYTSGYLIVAMVASAILILNFPTSVELGIFSGDVSIPNPRLNFITAIVTFLTILWFGVRKNIRKANLAQEAGIPTEVIEQTQKEMFKESLKNSTLLGVGAYLITNQIPSAFELSIFTLEIISLSSPLTLDKIILSATTKKDPPDEEKKDD